MAYVCESPTSAVRAELVAAADLASGSLRRLSALDHYERIAHPAWPSEAVARRGTGACSIPVA
jgi:hypothetical protein